jgi:hypothetical protein
MSVSAGRTTHGLPAAPSFPGGSVVNDLIPNVGAGTLLERTLLADVMAELQDDLAVPAWRISKRLVDLRYSASFTATHRGRREELLLTTLPPSRVPVNDR